MGSRRDLPLPPKLNIHEPAFDNIDVGGVWIELYILAVVHCGALPVIQLFIVENAQIIVSIGNRDWVASSPAKIIIVPKAYTLDLTAERDQTTYDNPIGKASMAKSSVTAFPAPGKTPASPIRNSAMMPIGISTTSCGHMKIWPGANTCGF